MAAKTAKAKAKAKAKPLSLHIDVVVYREEGLYVAHALQLDLVVTAPTEKEAMDDLIDVCVAQISDAFENDNLKYLFRSAPLEAWQKWRKAKGKRPERTIQPRPIKKAWMPSLSFCYGAA